MFDRIGFATKVPRGVSLIVVVDEYRLVDERYQGVTYHV